ncbi:hypothetical protein NE237_006495 [Protea cynaroides]|uniref:Secreted protein n=1 Tax=Protea cynaroides TaxID=273540 RepID=A0A9Q0KN78_9MAGN|nr:hypothetical protein NE237_006495 [Protea cynaroides]
MAQGFSAIQQCLLVLPLFALIVKRQELPLPLPVSCTMLGYDEVAVGVQEQLITTWVGWVGGGGRGGGGGGPRGALCSDFYCCYWVLLFVDCSIPPLFLYLNYLQHLCTLFLGGPGPTQKQISFHHHPHDSYLQFHHLFLSALHL